MWTYLRLVTIGWFDIIHDVDVDIIQYNTRFGHARSFPKNTPEDDTSLRRRYLYNAFSTVQTEPGNMRTDLNGSFNALEAVRRNGIY